MKNNSAKSSPNRSGVRAVLMAIVVLIAGCTSCGGGGGSDNGVVPVELPEFDADRAFADIEHQCDFGPRMPGSDGHQYQLEWMISTLTPLADDDPIQQSFNATTPFGGSYDFTNLIAVFSAEAPGVTTMIGAHWDTRPVADEDPNPELRDQPVPGANDGGSGVAILLELARIFNEQPPPSPVYLAFFDAEDSGKLGCGLPYIGFCMGSDYMAHNWPAQIEQPDRVIVLDLVGGQVQPEPAGAVGSAQGSNEYFNLRIEPYSQAAAPELVDHIWDIAEFLGHSAFERSSQAYIIDDHLPFINTIGIPAVDIIDFIPPVWHTVSDTPEHCDPDALYQVGETMLGLVYWM